MAKKTKLTISATKNYFYNSRKTSAYIFLLTYFCLLLNKIICIFNSIKKITYIVSIKSSEYDNQKNKTTILVNYFNFAKKFKHGKGTTLTQRFNINYTCMPLKSP